MENSLVPRLFRFQLETSSLSHRILIRGCRHIRVITDVGHD